MSTLQRKFRGLEFLARLRDDFIIFHTDYPLKIGIHLDIKELYPDVSVNVIKEAIRRHIRTVAYQRQLSMDTERFNLRGEVAGTVNAKHRRRAKRFLQFQLHQD